MSTEYEVGSRKGLVDRDLSFVLNIRFTPSFAAERMERPLLFDERDSREGDVV